MDIKKGLEKRIEIIKELEEVKKIIKAVYDFYVEEDYLSAKRFYDLGKNIDSAVVSILKEIMRLECNQKIT